MGWDKQITAIAGVFMIAGLGVPGLDLRSSRSTQFGTEIQPILDLPDVIGLRQQLTLETDRKRFIAS